MADGVEADFLRFRVVGIIGLESVAFLDAEAGVGDCYEFVDFGDGGGGGHFGCGRGVGMVCGGVCGSDGVVGRRLLREWVSFVRALIGLPVGVDDESG